MKILKDGSANKDYDDVCQEPQHFARIAYNNDAWLYVYDYVGYEWDYMYEYEVYPVYGEYPQMMYDYEILNPFFEIYHITPIWINTNYTWGVFDEETGHWTGAIGQVKERFNKY